MEIASSQDSGIVHARSDVKDWRNASGLANLSKAWASVLRRFGREQPELGAGNGTTASHEY